jgi:uncharacterized membrane protein
MGNNKLRIQRITGIGLFSAAVIVLQFVSMSLRFTTFSITLTLIPIVVGAAVYGIGAGAWLGLVFGLAVLLTGDAAAFLAISIPGTIITVLAKGVLAGIASGGVFKLLEKKNRAVASVVAAMVCPIVNSGVFFLGCLTFFMSEIKRWAFTDFGDNAIKYILFVLIGFNFILEFAINTVFSPTVTHVVRIGKKFYSKK